MENGTAINLGQWRPSEAPGGGGDPIQGTKINAFLGMQFNRKQDKESKPKKFRPQRTTPPGEKVAEPHHPEAGATKPCTGSESRPLDVTPTSSEDAPVHRSQGLHKAPNLGMRLRAGAAATLRQGCKETRKSLCATAIVSVLLILAIIGIRELGWIRLHSSSPVD